MISHKELRAPRLGEVELNGANASIMERFFDKRVSSENARKTIYQEAEDAFRQQSDDSSGIFGLWWGEFWGKWMIGTARVCEYTNDEKLRTFMVNAAEKLIGMQSEDGYLNSYRDPDFYFAADTEKSEELMGWPCDWNWNVWCRKYTLWGLLEIYQQTERSSILVAARRLTDHLIKQLHDAEIHIYQTGVFSGIPSSSILKPVLLLYRITEDEKYLDFAEEIADGLDRKGQKPPCLVGKALSGQPVHEWYPEPPRWAKVYEMLSCFDGLLELYRINGNSRLLEAAQRFHRLLKDHELNILFGVGFNDIFYHGAERLNAITEPCDVIHWMRLCYELFCLTGDKIYMDDFEMAFYNPFLAGVYRDGTWGARGVRSHGHHLTSFQIGLKHNHCCVNNMPRGFLNMIQAAVLYDSKNLVISLYSELSGSFSTEFGKITLSVTGDYLANGTVSIKLETEITSPFLLKMRIPAWAAESYGNCNQQPIQKNEDYLEVAIDHSGEYLIELSFSRIALIRHHQVPTGDSSWYLQRWVEDETEGNMKELFCSQDAATIVYGPLLLARSKSVGNTEEEMFEKSFNKFNECKLKLIDSAQGHLAFLAEFDSESGLDSTSVCDYASASNVLTKDQRYFSIFF